MKSHFSFQLHITDKCDLRCKHCYLWHTGAINSTMNLDNLEVVVTNCLKMCEKINRTPIFYITGGDPILHEDFWDLCESLKNKKLEFSILGNSFHLTDDVCKKLVDHGCKNYQLSIDGMERTHDSIRARGSFKDTIEKISVIKKAGMKCHIMTTISKTNMYELLEIIDLVVTNDVDVFSFARHCKEKNEKGDTILPDEYRDLLDKCYKKFDECSGCHTTFSLKDHLWTLYLYEEGLFTIDENLDKDIIYDGCNCGNCHMTILPTGDVYACRRFSSKVGNVFQDNMYDIFIGYEMENYRNFDRFEKCSQCELLRFCRGCPAVAYSEYGNYYSPDPQCWKTIVQK